MVYTYFMARLLLAVKRKCVLVGFTLTDPILLSESPYFRAFDLSSRRSTCVTPPELSEIHNSWPVGGRSMLEMRFPSSFAKTSFEPPETKERLRTVQS